LQYLEALPVHADDAALPARFPVQFVIRPHSEEHHDFRGYAGKLASGILRVGDRVTVLPSLKSSAIKHIHLADKKVEQAHTGESVTIELEDDVDVSRGNMIVQEHSAYTQANAFTARLTWMDEQPLTNGKTLLLQHGVNVVKAKVTALQSVLNINTMEESQEVNQFKLNDIGVISLKTAKPVFADTYKENPANGAFILIDEFFNTTVAVGFIERF